MNPEVVCYVSPNDESSIGELQSRLSPEDWIVESGNPRSETSVLIQGLVQRENLTPLRNLRAIIIPFAGIPQATRETCAEFPHISLHNIHHNAIEAAEHAIALMMAAAKDVVRMDSLLRKHDWSPRYESTRSIRLSGKTALIIGFGAVGTRIASACRGLEMNTIALRRNSEPIIVNQTHVFCIQAIHDLLPTADVVILALPLTPETENLIGEKEFLMMKKTCVFVNVARAKIVNEESLYAALKNREIHSAELDVWYQYPTEETAKNTSPSAFPFHQLENVVITPHRGGESSEVEIARIEAIAELLNAGSDRKTMTNVVDVRLGY